MAWSSQNFYNIWRTPGIGREAAVAKEVLLGNVPSWCFAFKKFVINDDLIEVMPDFLAIGPDNDFVRVPLTPFAAQFIADRLKVALPNPLLVDALTPNVKALPQHWYEGDGSEMRYGPNYVEHNKLIQNVLIQQKWRPGQILAGHKKHVVSAKNGQEHKVSIYGPTWGQPLFSGHDWFWEDYSHGIRFVKDPTGKYSGKCCATGLPGDFYKAMGVYK